MMENKKYKVLMNNDGSGNWVYGDFIHQSSDPLVDKEFDQSEELIKDLKNNFRGTDELFFIFALKDSRCAKALFLAACRSVISGEIAAMS